jgi:hypothetical protein
MGWLVLALLAWLVFNLAFCLWLLWLGSRRDRVRAVIRRKGGYDSY